MSQLSPNEAKLRAELIASSRESMMLSVGVELIVDLETVVQIFGRYSKAQALAVIGEDDIQTNAHSNPDWFTWRNDLRASQRQLLEQEGES